MKFITATLFAATMLSACSKEPETAKLTQEEINKINARLWQFENKPLPPPREKKPGQF